MHARRASFPLAGLFNNACSPLSLHSCSFQLSLPGRGFSLSLPPRKGVDEGKPTKLSGMSMGSSTPSGKFSLALPPRKVRVAPVCLPALRCYAQRAPHCRAGRNSNRANTHAGVAGCGERGRARRGACTRGVTQGGGGGQGVLHSGQGGVGAGEQAQQARAVRSDLLGDHSESVPRKQHDSEGQGRGASSCASSTRRRRRRRRRPRPHRYRCSPFPSHSTGGVCGRIFGGSLDRCVVSLLCSLPQLKRNGITHVLNCAGMVCPNYFPDDFVYRTLWLSDGKTENIQSHFYHVLDFMDDAIENGGERSCGRVVVWSWARSRHVGSRSPRPECDAPPPPPSSSSSSSSSCHPCTALLQTYFPTLLPHCCCMIHDIPMSVVSPRAPCARGFRRQSVCTLLAGRFPQLNHGDRLPHVQERLAVHVHARPCKSVVDCHACVLHATQHRRGGVKGCSSREPRRLRVRKCVGAPVSDTRPHTHSCARHRHRTALNCRRRSSRCAVSPTPTPGSRASFSTGTTSRTSR